MNPDKLGSTALVPTEISMVEITDANVTAVAERLGCTEADVREQLDDDNRAMLDDLDQAVYAVAGVYPARRLKP